jgi:protochlorophyllide reductase
MSTVYMVLWLVSHKTDRHQPQQRRKTVIITGGNRGVGLAAAKQLAETNEWDIILACRSKELGIAAKESIISGAQNVSVMPLDLSDVCSVRQFAKSWGDRKVDCLALNAGIHTGGRREPLLSKDGHELTVATNHIGHFYLTELLRRNIELSKNGRVVYVTSSRK